MQDLNVALVQRELAWEDPPANRAQFEADIAALDAGTDLVILPEMFTTGFSMAADKVAEPGAATTLPWLKQLAREHDVAITGSLAVREGEQYYNRLLFVTPEDHHHYDKRHLFSMSGEDRHYAAGSDKLIVEWRDWRICPMICYDLRFPVWTRNTADETPENYDLLIFVANWPAKRRVHWRQLLIARAIENQACCIGLNRVGSDDNGLDYSGDSLALAADGEILLDCADGSGVFSASLDRHSMDNYRARFPCHRDADEFQLSE
jgi:predicted amidohydrolase